MYAFDNAKGTEVAVNPRKLYPLNAHLFASHLGRFCVKNLL